MKVYKELVATWDNCISQIKSFDGFKEGVDVSLLSLAKDEKGEDYPDGPTEVDIPLTDEFYSFLPSLSL
ncbi:UNVERIFIED_CONTAM: hypothetical protein Sradi_1535900 [Sesamum radiatum]|uniref:Uncharacterized protein n=1 Tax=Sesamum radiatum TaxID=300843 RepID=A0AAW2UAB1_SESRA